MASAWHREDDREYADAPLVMRCDSPGCGGTVTLAAEDWRDNDSHYCRQCVTAVVCGPHPVQDWPEDLWF
jgi:hypothetical protein